MVLRLATRLTAGAVLVFSLSSHAASLVGKWTMDEGSGSAVANSVGTDLQGTRTANAGWSTQGKMGGSIDFASAGSMVTTSVSPTSFPFSAGTIAFWYKPHYATSNTTAAHDLAMVGPFHWSGGRIHIYNNASYQAIRIDHNGAYSLLSSTQLQAEQWVHITYTWNSTTGQQAYYLNGAINQSSVLAGGWTPNTTPNQLNIGQAASYTNYADGRLDEFRVYSGALTAAEVLALYTEDAQAPTQVTNLVANAFDYQRIDLSWSAATDNVAVTGYKVSRNGQLVTTVNGTSFSDIGLTPATTYNYTVTATDAAANQSIPSASAQATTPAQDQEAPSIPSGVQASSSAWNQASVSWNASTDNVGVTGYKVYRNGQLLTTTTALTYQDNTLAAGTTYAYTVLAFDARSNQSAQSTASSVTTASTALLSKWSMDEGAGTTVANSEGSFFQGTRTNASVWSTQGKLGGSLDFPAAGAMVTTPVTPATFPFSKGTIAFWYKPHYATSTSSAGHDLALVGPFNWSAGRIHIYNNASYQAIRIDHNGAYSLLSGTQLASEQWVHLTYTWNSTTGQQAYYLNGVLNQSSTLSGGWTPNTTPNQLNIGQGSSYSTHADGRLDDFRVYSGALTAAQVQSVYEEGAPPADLQAPTQVNGLGATVVDHQAINLAWNASTDNIGVTGYKIFRNSQLVRTQTNTSFADVGLSPATTYSYSVTAVDAAGNESVQSNSIQATTETLDQEPPSIPGSVSAASSAWNQASVSWNASTDNVGVVGYRVFRNGQFLTTTTALSLQDFNLLSGTSYAYTIKAFDAKDNESAPSLVASLTTPSDLRTSWTFDEGQGAYSADATGNGPSMTLQGGAQWAPVGRVGSGLNLTNTTQSAISSVPGNFDFTQGTVSFWYKPQYSTTTTTLEHDLFLLGPNTYSTGRIRIYNNASYQAIRVDHDGSSPSLLSYTTLQAPSWVFLTYTWNATTGVKSYYRNGVLDKTTTVPGGWVPSNSPSQIILGRSANYATGADGIIDEVKIYGHDLAASQIQGIYATTAAATDIDAPTVPQDLKATVISARQVNLLWTPSNDDYKVSGYRVYRNDTLQGTVAWAGYSDTSLLPSSTYAWRVVAVDSTGNASAASAPVQATTTASIPANFNLTVYGGATNLGFSGQATGYFHTQKIGNRWHIIDPLGAPFFLKGVYNATATDQVITAKYGSHLAWADATAAKLFNWGFNTAAEYGSRYIDPTYAGATNAPKLPAIHLLAPSSFAMRDSTMPTKDIVAGVRSDVYTASYKSRSPDVFDTAYAGWLRRGIVSGPEWGYKEWYTGANQQYTVGFAVDDLDYMWGFGPGPDFVPYAGKTPDAGKRQPHLGFLVLVTSRLQTSDSALGISHYADTVVHSKVALGAFLDSVYGGDIQALNTAWGSKYTSFGSTGAWGAGTGILDEDGKCPSRGSSACWIQSGDFQESGSLASSTAAMRADMDGYLEYHARRYFSDMRNVVKTYWPNHLYLGTTVLGSWGAPARAAIYRAAAPFIDMLGSMGSATYAPDQQQRMDFVANLVGDKPWLLWAGFSAQANSALSSTPASVDMTDFDRQESRGIHYQNVIRQATSLHLTNGTYPYVGIKFWELHDSNSEHTNWGLATRKGNSYDGVEARQGAQACTDNVVAGWTCGNEAGDYGDFIGYVRKANQDVYRQIKP